MEAGGFVALTTAANVRALGLVEVVFSYLVSQRLREQFSKTDNLGLACVAGGLLLFGLFSIVEARYRSIHKPPTEHIKRKVESAVAS